MEIEKKLLDQFKKTVLQAEPMLIIWAADQVCKKIDRYDTDRRFLVQKELRAINAIRKKSGYPDLRIPKDRDYSDIHCKKPKFRKPDQATTIQQTLDRK